MWPLLPIAPGAVALIGIGAAMVIGSLGLASLRAEDEIRAASRADLLATTLAERLPSVAEEDRSETLQRAARRTGSELVLVSSGLDLLIDASLGRLDAGELRRVIDAHDGETVTGIGRVRFAARALSRNPDSAVLVAFVRAPGVANGAYGLVTALVALTTLLVAVAAAVAYALARDANKDVDFAASRVRGMLQVRSEPTGEAVPLRTMDEVGALTVAFNALVDRFAAARAAYQSDLERVHAADRDRAAFLAAVSHELRSPLNAILGFADVLTTEVDGPLSEDAREEVGQIRGSGAHLLDLINDILELSAIESGQLKLARCRVDLGAIAFDVVREAAGLLGDRPVALRVEAVEGVVALGDPKRIRQILTNLVGNAVKFTQRGDVVVRVGREEGFARLSVCDTGPGISPEERSIIFDEYKQSKDERPRRRGTGLGLAITKRLVTMHGGRIRLESEIGRGSDFDVLLPLAEDAPAGPA
jgi:signal transduction histidine kinase